MVGVVGGWCCWWMLVLLVDTYSTSWSCTCCCRTDNPLSPPPQMDMTDPSSFCSGVWLPGSVRLCVYECLSVFGRVCV